MKSLFLAGVLIVVIIAGGIFLYSKSGGVETGVNGNPTNNSANQQNQDSKQIILTSGGFSPSTLTIKAGTMVTWTNKSGKDAQVDSDPHPIHTSYPPMNFDVFSDGSSVSLVFDKPDTYHYHNHLNPSQTGTIVVQ